MGAVWLPVAHLTILSLSSAWPENSWRRNMAQHIQDSKLLFILCTRVTAGVVIIKHGSLLIVEGTAVIILSLNTHLWKL